MSQDSKPSGGEFDNKEVETVTTVAHCSAAPSARPEGKPQPAKAVIDPVILKLVKDTEAKRFDQRVQAGPAPSDLGEYPPIAEEAIVQIPMEADDTWIAKAVEKYLERQADEQDSDDEAVDSKKGGSL